MLTVHGTCKLTYMYCTLVTCMYLVCTLLDTITMVPDPGDPSRYFQQISKHILAITIFFPIVKVEGKKERRERRRTNGEGRRKEFARKWSVWACKRNDFFLAFSRRLTLVVGNHPTCPFIFLYYCTRTHVLAKNVPLPANLVGRRTQ